jgi:hypothetical protein
LIALRQQGDGTNQPFHGLARLMGWRPEAVLAVTVRPNA